MSASVPGPSHSPGLPNPHPPAPGSEDGLEAGIARWRAFVLRRGATDVPGLETQLRTQVAGLAAAGLSGHEALLIAVTRVGAVDPLSAEFAREHAGLLLKPLTSLSADRPGSRELLVVVGLALAAALSIKVPALFGLDMEGDGAGFYARNLSFFALPFLGGYFAWRRRLGTGAIAAPAGLFLAGAVAANAYPFAAGGATEVLTIIHVPIALWLVVGVAYLGGEWRPGGDRMGFVRFTGEWFISYVLIALGGGVLVALTVGVFDAIGLDIETFLVTWLLPCGAVGAAVVSAWLVEAKQSVFENLAPVLTKVFTPLFAAMFIAFLAAIVWTGRGIDTGRDVLILVDLLLVLVLGLLLFAISARDPQAPPATTDLLQLVLVVGALVIDALALAAIVSRISEFGFSANKTAALGMNLILAVNLAWSAWLSFGFIRGRRHFADLERWQTGYIPVYGVWAAVVAVAFPPLFGFA